MPALLYGPPGTGKTSVVEAAFPDLITVPGDGDTTVADLVGEYRQTPEGRYLFVHGPLVRAMREGRALCWSTRGGGSRCGGKLRASRCPTLRQPDDGATSATVRSYGPRRDGARYGKAVTSRISVAARIGDVEVETPDLELGSVALCAAGLAGPGVTSSAGPTARS